MTNAIHLFDKAVVHYFETCMSCMAMNKITSDEVFQSQENPTTNKCINKHFTA